MQTPLVIAHRGDSSNALENSPEAFRLALSVPADMIEFDVRKSRDGGLYVMHDKQSGRTADRNLDIEAASLWEIAGIKLKNGEPVPSLDLALGIIAGKAGVNIEIKSGGAGKVLADRLVHRPFPGRILVSSFMEAEVRAFRAAAPGVPVAVVYDSFSPRHIPEYRAGGYSAISLRKNTVTEHLVRACRDQGIGVFVWTVDDEEEMKRCIGWQVDGIYTNKPGLLKRVRNAECGV